MIVGDEAEVRGLCPHDILKVFVLFQSRGTNAWQYHIRKAVLQE